MNEPGQALLAACDLLQEELQALRVGTTRAALAVALALCAGLVLAAGLLGTGVGAWLALSAALGKTAAALCLGIAGLALAGLLVRAALAVSQ